MYLKPGTFPGRSVGVCSNYVCASLSLGFRLSRRLSALPVAPLLGLPSWRVELGSLSFLDAPSDSVIAVGLSAGWGPRCPSGCGSGSALYSRGHLGSVAGQLAGEAGVWGGEAGGDWRGWWGVFVCASELLVGHWGDSYSVC